MANTTRQHLSQRPVLIITDTVHNAEAVVAHLKQEGVSQNKIRAYMRDLDEVEKHFEASPAAAGDVVVATNKGGRGTDIRVSEASNRDGGGLHVLLAYLPSNDRIEAQAFGRTARNGCPGSGQFVVLVDDDEEILDELVNLSGDERLARLHELGESVLERKREERNRLAERFLGHVMDVGILHLDIEQALFDEFKSIGNAVCANCRSLIDSYAQNKLANTKDSHSLGGLSSIL